MSTATEVSFTHTSHDAADARLRFENRSRERFDHEESPAFRYVSWEQIELLYGMFVHLENEHDVTLLIGEAETRAQTPPGWWYRQAQITPANSEREVILARNGFLFSGSEASGSRLGRRSVSSRRLEERGFPAIADLVREGSAFGEYEWHISGDESDESSVLTIGTVAPNIVTLPFWWRTISDSESQQRALYEGLRAAIERSLDNDLADALRKQQAEITATMATELLRTRGTTERQNLESEVTQLVGRCSTAEAQMRQSEQRLTEIRAQLRAIADATLDESELATTVSGELAEIDRHPDIVDMEVSVDTMELRVTTAELPLTRVDDPDSTTIGGSYQIAIKFSPSGGLVVTNLTRRVGDYDHPHVSSGQFCLGDQRRLLASLTERVQLSAAVSLVIDLLKQVNPDDVYTQEWEAWFDLPESEVA